MRLIPKYSMVPLSFIFAIINSFPIPWRLRLMLFKHGLSLKNPVLLYGSQIDCQGGKIFHSFYLRRYFFPLYGQEKHRRYSLEWLKDRLELCRRILKKKGIEAKSQHSNLNPFSTEKKINADC